MSENKKITSIKDIDNSWFASHFIGHLFPEPKKSIKPFTLEDKNYNYLEETADRVISDLKSDGLTDPEIKSVIECINEKLKK